MNDQSMSSAPGSSLIPDSTSLITGTHFVFMAIFAVLVVLGILWGMRLKRRRDRADEEVAQDNRDIAVTDRDPPGANIAVSESADGKVADAPRATASPSPTPKAASVAPIAPAPPPMGNAPVVGTPAATAPVQDGATTAAIPVTRLKGLGPKVAARLADLGITDAAQLAALSDEEAADLDAQLGSFSGRMARDRWIEQARMLTNGDTAGFEAAFGKL